MTDGFMHDEYAGTPGGADQSPAASKSAHATPDARRCREAQRGSPPGEAFATSRMRILATSDSTTAIAPHRTTTATGSTPNCHHVTPGAWARRSARRSRAPASGAQPRPTGGRRGRVRRTRAAGPRGSSSARGACPGCPPAVAPFRRSRRARTRSRRARRQGSTRRRCRPSRQPSREDRWSQPRERRLPRKNERRLDEHRDRQVAARTHQREAVRDVPRRGRNGEACKREEPNQRRGNIMPDTEIRRSLSHRHKEHARSRFPPTRAGATRYTAVARSTVTVLFPHSRRSSR